MKVAIHAVAALAVVLSVAATAQTARKVPSEVANWANEQRADCVGSGGRFTGSSDFYQTADFNGDGRLDFIVTRSAFRCSLGLTWSLDGQMPSYEFFVSSGGRYIHAGYQSSAEDIKIVRSGNRDVIEITTGGPGVRKSGLQRIVMAWDGTRMAPMASRSRSGSQALRPVPNNMAPAPPSSRQNGIGPLGIIAGNYVAENEPCDRPSTVFHYDGRRIGQASRGERWFEPIGRVDREGGGLFLFDHGILIKSLGGGRIQRTVQDTGPIERLCPREKIPVDLRL